MAKKPRPDCVAFVYGDQHQKRKLEVLAADANMSASAYVISLIERRYDELFPGIDVAALTNTPGS